MTIDLVIPLVTGFLASFHCVGMCGPIVTGYVAQKPIAINIPGVSSIRFSQILAPHIYYHAGRVLSYGLVGVFAGGIGSLGMFDPVLQRWFSILLGLVMIAAGLFQLDVIKVKARSTGGLLKKLLQGFGGTQNTESRFYVGLLTPLLPCGLLYAMAAQSAASLSPAYGALTMAAFALGGMPALLVTGMSASILSAKARRLGTRIAVLLIIIMGVLTIARGFGLTTSLLRHPTSIIERLCGA